MSVGQISEAVAGRDAGAVMAEARDLIEPVYRAAVDGMPAEVRHIAGYHAGWWDVDGRPTRQAGKAVRPAVALACARAAGGVADEAVVAAGVAVELVHDFSLLHDDVMDGDLTRRHRPTAWAAFGIGPAILVGDVLLTTAMQQAGTGAGVRVLAQAVLDLCAGQSADLAFEERDDVEVPECLAMAEGKTGALLGAACELGALAGGAGPAAARWYRTFGRQLGVAFQLVDDLLGIWGDPAATGKPAGADLVARKKSLPVVAALTSGTQAGAHLAYLYGRDETWDETAIAHVAGLVEAAGGRRWAQAEADRRIEAALTALQEARPAPAAAADLHALSALITRRDR